MKRVFVGWLILVIGCWLLGGSEPLFSADTGVKKKVGGKKLEKTVKKKNQWIKVKEGERITLDYIIDGKGYLIYPFAVENTDGWKAELLINASKRVGDTMLFVFLRGPSLVGGDTSVHFIFGGEGLRKYTFYGKGKGIYYFAVTDVSLDLLSWLRGDVAPLDISINILGLSEKGENEQWCTINQWTGSGDERTEVFTINDKKWRVVGNAIASESFKEASFLLSIYRFDGKEVAFWDASFTRGCNVEGSDELCEEGDYYGSVALEEKGDYHLEIETKNVEKWMVSVETLREGECRKLEKGKPERNEGIIEKLRKWLKRNQSPPSTPPEEEQFEEP
jgi:hypothetical protein